MAKLVINADRKLSHINKELQGHFSEHLGRCIYEGLYVGENSEIPNVNGMRTDVVEALKQIRIPVLRWPGGCFADEYHWKDGIGPKEGRKKIVNTHWGGVVEDNSCGGNMNPDFYGNMYRRYQTYVRNYAGNKPIQKIACGANVDDYEWTEEVMKTTFRRNEPGQHGFMDGLSLHYYTHPGGWLNKGSATEFDEKKWYQTMKKTWYMDELITRHGAIMDKYDPKKEVGMIVDEWGTWFEVEPGTNPGFLYQQNTMRDALVAGINLNIFNKHSDRVKMANIAQMINVLQAVILTEGSKMIKTPTYHVFDMYKYHQDADLLDSTLETEIVGLEEENMVPNLSESVSIDADGVMHITMTNLDLEHAYPIETTILGKKVESIKAQIVTQEMHAKNTFEDPENVTVQFFEGVEKVHAGIKFTIPACSVLHIALK